MGIRRERFAYRIGETPTHGNRNLQLSIVSTVCLGAFLGGMACLSYARKPARHKQERLLQIWIANDQEWVMIRSRPALAMQALRRGEEHGAGWLQLTRRR